MDRIQERIMQVALQIPEYVGYQAKERRRDADKLVRRQLAGKYDEQRMRLTRLARQAPLDYIVDLENLDQKLLRLIARLNTAPGGYAGWFDAALIVEGDLDQLTQFDANLTAGVAQLKNALDPVAVALKARDGVADAIGACAELLDTLNSQFDQREQFLALGKKPTLSTTSANPVSPLHALETTPVPSAQFTQLTRLKLRDAVSFAGADYLVDGKLAFGSGPEAFWAFRLRDGEQERWLRLGPDEEIGVGASIDFRPSQPWPGAVEYEHQTLTLKASGRASVTVEGAGGAERGTAEYALYAGESGNHLWLEDYDGESRTAWGQLVDPLELKIYRR